MGLHAPELSESTVCTTDDIVFPRQQGGGKKGSRFRSQISTKSSFKQCSIPSKFSTVLFDKSHISGFGSSKSRFELSDLSTTTLPGPGNYESFNMEDLSRTNPSFSKKGYGGGFVSETDKGVKLKGNI